MTTGYNRRQKLVAESFGLQRSNRALRLIERERHSKLDSRGLSRNKHRLFMMPEKRKRYGSNEIELFAEQLSTLTIEGATVIHSNSKQYGDMICDVPIYAFLIAVRQHQRNHTTFNSITRGVTGFFQVSGLEKAGHVKITDDKSAGSRFCPEEVKKMRAEAADLVVRLYVLQVSL